MCTMGFKKKTLKKSKKRLSRPLTYKEAAKLLPKRISKRKPRIIERFSTPKQDNILQKKMKQNYPLLTFDEAKKIERDILRHERVRDILLQALGKNEQEEQEEEEVILSDIDFSEDERIQKNLNEFEMKISNIIRSNEFKQLSNKILQVAEKLYRNTRLQAISNQELATRILNNTADSLALEIIERDNTIDFIHALEYILPQIKEYLESSVNA